jgi:hypothetical protein
MTKRDRLSQQSTLLPTLEVSLLRHDTQASISSKAVLFTTSQTLLEIRNIMFKSTRTFADRSRNCPSELTSLLRTL